MITIEHHPSHVAVYHGDLFYNTGSFDPPNYPMPAIPTHHFISNVATIAIWPGVIQWRISDQPYTGFGKVITIEHGVRCDTRYDDFD